MMVIFRINNNKIDHTCSPSVYEERIVSERGGDDIKIHAWNNWPEQTLLFGKQDNNG